MRYLEQEHTARDSPHAFETLKTWTRFWINGTLQFLSKESQGTPSWVLSERDAVELFMGMAYGAECATPGLTRGLPAPLTRESWSFIPDFVKEAYATHGSIHAQLGLPTRAASMILGASPEGIRPSPPVVQGPPLGAAATSAGMGPSLGLP